MKTILQHSIHALSGLRLPAIQGILRTLGMLAILVLPVSMHAQTLNLNGQVIGWSTINPAEPFQVQGGLRYIPELKFEVPLGNLTLEGEGSLNIWGAATYAGGDTLGYDHEFSLYRAWAKIAGNQWELRAGLQKINFGSARMLRPLMWFDRIDPRDPLQLTDGVYGLLGRYYFLNNANIWLWGLYGNNEIKGPEQFPTREKGFEFGGRVQVPVTIGEAALSYHHREADPDAVLPDSLHTGNTYPENRIAFDTKVDLGVGLWLEGSLTQHNLDFSPIDFTTLLNAGIDYTFNTGNGLNIMSEGFLLLAGEKPFASDQQLSFLGATVSYPLNIIHNLSGIVFYDFTNSELYRFINWSATFDRWTFYTMAFWNPKNYQLYNFQQEASLFSGAGFQLMAVFNY
jgi:hypothetical protein